APAPPPIPAGAAARLPDGTLVYFSGPTTVSRGAFIPARFTFLAASGRGAQGEVTIALGDITKDPRYVTASLDSNGNMAIDVPATLPLGQYPLSVIYKGQRAQVATITIR
ncbi:MAG TPA: hypothetical protein VJQ09_00385, partial [Candidatus Limnocylindria bacterium]|nr:hypothetical protein [Candidatus Limnocylindria bacterium]